MLFSVRDIELLRLLRWCRFVDPNDIRNQFDDITIQNLMTLKLIRVHKATGVFTLTAEGSKLLDTQFRDMPELNRLSYQSAAIERRIRVSKLTLTAYRAGLSVFATRLSALEEDAAYFLPTLMRGRGANPWGNSRVAALLRLGATLYAAHCVYPGVGNLLLHDEWNAFRNNTSQIERVSRSFFFAGESYQSVLEELCRPSTGRDGRLVSYGEAWRSLSAPVHLLACTDAGALQLRLMSIPDYRQRLTHAALRSKFTPAPPEIPYWDALFDGIPFVIAADMDLRRIDAAAETARKQGIGKIAIAGLGSQVREVLNRRYKEPGLARVFTLTDEALRSLGDMELYTPSPEGYRTAEGGVIHAPLIQISGKTGRPAGKPLRKLDRAQ